MARILRTVTSLAITVAFAATSLAPGYAQTAPPKTTKPIFKPVPGKPPTPRPHPVKPPPRPIPKPPPRPIPKPPPPRPVPKPPPPRPVPKPPPWRPPWRPGGGNGGRPPYWGGPPAHQRPPGQWRPDYAWVPGYRPRWYGPGWRNQRPWLVGYQPWYTGTSIVAGLFAAALFFPRINAAITSNGDYVGVPGTNDVYLIYPSVVGFNRSFVSFNYVVNGTEYTAEGNCRNFTMDGRVPQTQNKRDILNAACIVAWS